MKQVRNFISTTLSSFVTSLPFACFNQAGDRYWNQAAPRNAIKSIKVRRSEANPLITFESSPSLGDNINGPSVIQVPSWIENPLGKYYMYFAHHSGEYIRLAYADNLEGPWKIYESGTLQLKQVDVFKGHVASPDVHVDKNKEEIRMYFHGPAKERKKQWTGVAVSKDGLNFTTSSVILGSSYFRVFKWGDYFYSIDVTGRLNRSKVSDSVWQTRRAKLVPPITIDDQYGKRTNVRIRHSAVLLRNDILFLFYSRKGDAPEQILVSSVCLTDDWRQWKASKPIEVLRPRERYEGIQYPILPSSKGMAIEVHQIRDPYLFEKNGKCYLFYSISGEMGIAMAEVEIAM